MTVSYAGGTNSRESDARQIGDKGANAAGSGEGRGDNRSTSRGWQIGPAAGRATAKWVMYFAVSFGLVAGFLFLAQV